MGGIATVANEVMKYAKRLIRLTIERAFLGFINEEAYICNMYLYLNLDWDLLQRCIKMTKVTYKRPKNGGQNLP